MWESLAQPGHISERIEKQIVSLVASEQLRPGDRLPSERELAVLLGVSRPPVREAVKSLQAKGLLEVRHGQGIFIAPPYAEHTLRTTLREQQMTLSELFAMREILEVPAAGLAAEANHTNAIKAAAAALEHLNESAARDSVDHLELGRLDAEFHLAIVKAAGNRFLNQTVGVLQEVISSGMETTLKIPGRVQRSRADHAKIMAAIEAGDAAAARRAARQHISGAHKAAMLRVQQKSEETESASSKR